MLNFCVKTSEPDLESQEILDVKGLIARFPWLKGLPDDFGNLRELRIVTDDPWVLELKRIDEE